MTGRNARKTAVVTGAAGGFGRCFARQLANQGYDLILIDRHETGLQNVVSQLSTEVPVNIQPAVIDLTNQKQVSDLATRLGQDETIEFLVNNAGFANLQNFVEIDMSQHMEMIALHVNTPARLIRAVLPGMIQRGKGNIVNVSSLGAWMPANDAQYAATKSYLLVLSQSLNHELRGTGVRVQALCPSFVDTGFHDTAKMNRFPRQSIPRRWWMQADDVIAASFSALELNRSVVIPGWRNRLISIGLRSPWINPIIALLLRSRPPATSVETVTS